MGFSVGESYSYLRQRHNQWPKGREGARKNWILSPFSIRRFLEGAPCSHQLISQRRGELANGMSSPMPPQILMTTTHYYSYHNAMQAESDRALVRYPSSYSRPLHGRRWQRKTHESHRSAWWVLWGLPHKRSTQGERDQLFCVFLWQLGGVGRVNRILREWKIILTVSLVACVWMGMVLLSYMDSHHCSKAAKSAQCLPPSFVDVRLSKTWSTAIFNKRRFPWDWSLKCFTSVHLENTAQDNQLE